MPASMTLAPAWLQCFGKERYQTPQLAAKVVKRRNAKGRTKTAKSRVKPATRQLQHYQCRHCGFFHIGGFGGK